MTMLHTVNRSPFDRNSLSTCLNHLAEGASVLLYEDGVYGALTDTGISAALQNAMGSSAVYVLGPDLKARGLDEGRLIDGVKVVEYGDFVDLAATADKVQSWL